MLQKLVINNIALIKHLELDFCQKLNVLSGETGAGKSIIVDGIMLLLGSRYDKSLLRFNESNGYVEGLFTSNEAALAALRDIGVEEDEVVIVNRKFYSDGKNEIRINGKLATTSMLKLVMSCLVDIYGQNDSQALIKPTEHLKIVDYYVRRETEEIKASISKLYLRLKAVKNELTSLGNIEERERNIELLRYEIDEIEKAALKANEEDELIALRRRANAAEKINASLSETVQILSENSDVTAIGLVDDAIKCISQIAEFSPAFKELFDRLESVSIELVDLAESTANELDSFEFDFSDLDKIERRLEVIRNLKRKYGEYEKMNAYFVQAQEKLFKLENCDEIYKSLLAEYEILVKDLYRLCCQLSLIRQNGAKILEKEILTQLRDLGMQEARFTIAFEPLCDIAQAETRFSPNGFDKLEFYLSPNKGQPLKPLAKIISGGEMSRFMLALKVISSNTDSIPTLIFDEIDTGISGKIGVEVAKKLAVISRSHQVLCVSHLSQIASMADNHYFISKASGSGDTVTDVTLLDYSGMVEEISRLSGSKDISADSAKAAKDMKEWSNTFKTNIK